jgi:regulatory protein
MERHDDHLAPVTYLPGVEKPRVRPTFAAMYDEPEVAAESVEPVVEPVETASSHSDTHADERAADTAARRAENVALHALTRRGMSRREVERTLRARELDDATVEAELERLEGVGLVDDLALAQDLVGRLQERKGLGRSAIAAELTRRLLAPAAISYALELVDGSEELSRAHEIAEKRAGQLGSYDRETARRRLTGFLQRRGYDGSTVRSAVDHALPARPAAGGTVRFR